MQIVYENDTVTHSCMKHIFKSGIQKYSSPIGYNEYQGDKRIYLLSAI